MRHRYPDMCVVFVQCTSRPFHRLFRVNPNSDSGRCRAGDVELKLGVVLGPLFPACFMASASALSNRDEPSGGCPQAVEHADAADAADAGADAGAPFNRSDKPAAGGGPDEHADAGGPDWMMPVPHAGLQLASFSPLSDKKARDVCPHCKRSRFLFCYDCVVPLTEGLPVVQLVSRPKRRPRGPLSPQTCSWRTGIIAPLP